jgi:hypothetical protein
MPARYSFLLVLFTAVILSGCLSDPIDGPVKVSRLVQRPNRAWLDAVTATATMRARWSPSPSDTQQNFKGYFIQIYRSAPYDPPAADGEDSVFEPAFDSVHVPKSDTSCIFSNSNIMKGRRYTIHVFAEQNHDPSKDTLILSSDYADATLVFDPDPVIAPATVLASSGGVQTVNLMWSVSASADTTNHPGFAGYIIRYRDNSSSRSTINEIRPGKINFTRVPISVTSSSSFLTPYLFWVKAVRNDSTESTDSTMIEWSGAWVVPQVGDIGREVHPGMKMFIGQTNSYYDLLETNAPEAQIGVDTAGGKLLLTALNNARFAKRIDTVANLDSLVYDKPFDDGVFTETSLTSIALNISDTTNSGKGYVIYVLFNEGTRARLHFLPDGTTGRSLMWSNGVLKVHGRFQSASYSLKYF